MRTRIVGPILLLLVATSASAQSFTPLGDLAGGGLPFSIANDISGDGIVVVGVSFSTSGQEAFRWVAPSGPMTGLGDLAGGGFGSNARGVNVDGSVVVGSGTTASGIEAMRYDVGISTMSSVDTPDSFAASVSDDGTVIAGCRNCNNSAPTGATAFVWDSVNGNTNLTSLVGSVPHIAFAISGDGRYVVGGDLAVGSFRVDMQTLIPTLTPPPPPNLFAGQGVSRDGFSVVGGAVFGLAVPLDGVPFRWVIGGGAAALLPLPGGGSNGQASDASADGLVIVGATAVNSGLTTEPVDAFIWDPTNGARLVKDVLTGLGVGGLAGWTLVQATAISDDGQTLVGWGENPSGDTEAWMAEIPRSGFASTPVPGGTPPPAQLLGGPSTKGGSEVVFGSGTGAGTLNSSFSEVPLSTFPIITPVVNLFGVPSDPVQLWEFSFTGTFTPPVMLTLGYDDTSLVVPEPSLQVFRYVAATATWTQLTKLSQDLTANTITVESPGFSLFALGTSSTAVPSLPLSALTLLALILGTAGVYWGPKLSTANRSPD